MRNLLSILSACLLAGCGGGDDPPRCTAHSGRTLVTADWLNRSLTLLDVGALADASCLANDAIVAAIDLGEHPPGPLEVEITPQGEAVVAVGPGFVTGVLVSADRVPPGGAVLVIDLDTRSVRHVVQTAHAPMGVAITPDGRYALTANYGEASVEGDTLSVIDLDVGQVIEEIVVGGRPEQVALDASGTRGIVNAAADDLVLGLSLDGAVSLGGGVDIGRDPSDVAFLSGDRAVATSSLGLSYSLLDLGDPLAPALLGTFATPSGIPYGITAIEGTREVLVTTSLTEATLVHADLAGDRETVLAEIPLAGSPLALVAVHDPETGLAFVPQPNDQRLTIVDLKAQTSRSLRWLTDVGPTYAALDPR